MSSGNAINIKLDDSLKQGVSTMETTLQIKIDESVLHNAENYAKKNNKSIHELLSNYLLHISKHSTQNETINEVNTYQELVEALDAGMDDIINGRINTHEEMKEHWEKKMGKNAIV